MVAQVFAHHLEEFARSRLQDLCHEPLRYQARRTVPNRRDFYFVAFRYERDHHVAIQLLDFFRLGDWSAQSHGQVTGEVIATDWNDRGVRNRALLEDNHVSGTGAQVGKTNTQFSFIRPQYRVGASQRLEHRVIHVNTGAVHGGYHVLGCARSRRDHVNPDFQARGHHSQRIVDASLLIEDELLWQQMHDLAVRGQWDATSFVDRKPNFIARDLTCTCAEADASMAVHATHMRAGNSHQCLFDSRAGGVFGLLDCLLDRRRCFLQVGDNAFAGTTRLGHAVPSVA